MADMSIEALRQKANEANNEHQKVDRRAGLAVDPLEAAMQRIDDAAKAAEEKDISAYKELKERDNREYEYEVEGFNIGDSIMRRARTLDHNAQQLSDTIEQDKIDEAIGEKEEKPVEEVKVSFEEDDLDFDKILKDAEEFNIEEEEVEGEADMPTEKETVTAEVVEQKEKTVEPVVAKQEDKDVTLSQSDIAIDEEDLLDLDFSEDTESSDEVSEEDLNTFREAITEKLHNTNKKPVKNGFTVVKKAVSLSQALAKIESNVHTIDYPLMSAGKNVTMKAFTGSEIDDLNRGAGSRNRFNTLKQIYKSIYDHITSEKPEFEEWLKVTSFLDIEHLYMAIYKASFDGANYIPYECTNDTCKHVFLSDNIAIENMIKFNTPESKKRFYSIFENSDKESAVSAKLYQTTVVPITDTIAIGFREPSIYNTIFENSVLDDKFIEKYQRLLSMMVYIDNIYIIDGEDIIPIEYKKDKNSVAKTAKYRIATYAKIIQSLPSDGYQKIVATLAEINNLGDSVQYVIPEYTCPKCKQTISEDVRSAQQLLFSRHQLSLLSQQ